MQYLSVRSILAKVFYLALQNKTKTLSRKNNQTTTQPTKIINNQFKPLIKFSCCIYFCIS